MARVLIADDADFMRMVLRRILEDAGHEVVGEADNGRDAVSLFTMLHPDVATLDITMPARPEVGAECTLYMDGFRPGVDGRWVITRAEHRIEDGGYTCSVSAEVPKTSEEGQ